MSTVALAVPIVLLLRHKKNFLADNLKSAAAPPRRLGSNISSTLQVMSVRPGGMRPASSHGENLTSEDMHGDFNGALYTAKAFGIATLLVGVGVASASWGVQAWLGVHNVRSLRAIPRPV